MPNVILKHNTNGVFSIFPSNSSCYDAFDRTVQPRKVEDILLRRPSLLNSRDEHARSNVALLAVNFGFGTTGTHALHDAMVRLFPVQRVHHYEERYAELFRVMRQCTGIKGGMSSTGMRQSVPQSKCRSKYILDKLSAVTAAVLQDSLFLSDTPMSVIFPDIFTIAPDLVTISTFRDMRSFMQSRNNHHRDDLICHPSLWGQPQLLHPFDITACLRLRDTVHEALYYASELYRRKSMKDDIKDAYRKQNSINMLLAAKNKKFLPLCLQDVNRDESTKIILRQVIDHFYETNISWGKNYQPTKIAPSVRYLLSTSVAPAVSTRAGGPYMANMIVNICPFLLVILVFLFLFVGKR